MNFIEMRMGNEFKGCMWLEIASKFGAIESLYVLRHQKLDR